MARFTFGSHMAAVAVCGGVQKHNLATRVGCKAMCEARGLGGLTCHWPRTRGKQSVAMFPFIFEKSPFALLRNLLSHTPATTLFTTHLPPKTSQLLAGCQPSVLVPNALAVFAPAGG